MRSIIVFLSFLVLSCSAWAQDPPAQASLDRNTAFDQANQLYDAEEFEKARSLYYQLAEKQLSKQVCFNLANTEFRLGRLGHASLWYRRALVMDPGMLESKANMRLLKRKLNFLEFRYSGVGQFVGWLTGSQWRLIFVIGLWQTLLGTAVLVVLRPRRPWFGIVLALTICGPLIATFGGVGGGINHTQRDIGSLGVVTGSDITAVTGPYPDAPNVIALPPGSEVRIKRKSADWYFLYIPGETAGWAPVTAIEPLWPYEAQP
ncbi:MAG: tetratricopeptide repeat protein [Verrucomicrobiota bacterium]